MGRPWTGREEALFAKLWKQGKSIKEISQQLDRTESTLRGRRLRMKLPPRLTKGVRSQRIQVLLSEVLLKELNYRANVERVPVSNYIRNILAREVRRRYGTEVSD